MAKDRVLSLIASEAARQRKVINLIASENIASKEVMAATGSVLTNKYAEGLPKKRYYGGTAVVDEIEQLAIIRAKKLFRAEYANVQPHSGAQANMAAYFAFLKPGDKVLAMTLDQGGHLTHGSPLTLPGKLYDFHFYGVGKKSYIIDMDEVEKHAKKVKPKMIVAGYSAYSRKLDFKRFRDIASSVDAILLVDMAHFAGLVAAGVYPSPVPYADVVTSTTHKTLRGPRGGFILSKKKYSEMVDKAVFPGIQGGPLEHVIAAKAVAFAEATKPSFKAYQKKVIENARALASHLSEFGNKVLTDGTDNHMFLIDTKRSWGITGKEAEERLGSAGIVVNRNAIPYDPEKPFIASGIRIGTPWVTTQGMDRNDMTRIAHRIQEALV